MTATDAHGIGTRERSLALARARGCHGSGPALTVGWTLDAAGGLVSLTVRVPSATRDTTYAVTYCAAIDDAKCVCLAATHGRPCWHRGVCIEAGRQVARIYSPSGRRESVAAYYDDLRAEANAVALAPSL